MLPGQSLLNVLATIVFPHGLAASVTLQPMHSLLRFGVMLSAIAFANLAPVL